MVSLNRVYSTLTLKLFLVMIFLTITHIYVNACPSNQSDCCVNGKLSCCRHPGYDSHGNELAYDISGCMDLEDEEEVVWPEDGEDEEEEAECLSGMSQYRPSGDCGTEENRCCPNGKWSGFNGLCAMTPSCTSSQCWNGSTCVNKPTKTCTCSNGTCVVNYSCSNGVGWISVNNCICKAGYTLKNGQCVKNSSIYYRWQCTYSNTSQCRNLTVNNRHESPCQSIAQECSAYQVGSHTAYYSCQDCYYCTCAQEEEFEVMPWD